MVFTNAAGGINLAYEQGGLVLISDHINLQGANPLVGPNDDSLGPRFPDMSEAYSRAYREIAKQVARNCACRFPKACTRPCWGRATRRRRRSASAHHRRRPGGDVDGARGDRRQPRGDEGARHLLRDEHGGGSDSRSRNWCTRKCWKPAPRCAIPGAVLEGAAGAFFDHGGRDTAKFSRRRRRWCRKNAGGFLIGVIDVGAFCFKGPHSLRLPRCAANPGKATPLFSRLCASVVN
jgi:hypothetical protein